jgi:hypothetical protein
MKIKHRMSVGATVLLLMWPHPVVGQEHPLLADAAAAWEASDFDGVLAAARAALGDTLSPAQQAEAWDWVARVYDTMGETESVIAALEQFVLHAPEWEFDPNERDPEFLTLHQIALSRNLVVRRVAVDSVTFPAGRGGVRVRFQVTQPAPVRTRLYGPGGFERDLGTIGLVGSVDLVEWDGLTPEGDPAPPGLYTFQISAGDSVFGEYTGFVRVALRRTEPVLLPHIDSIPGWSEYPETESPPRDWKPLAIAGLAAAVGTGATLMIESSSTGVSYRELIAINVGALLTGLWWSLKQPEPQPVQANIRFNRLLRRQIDRENQRIDEENARLRGQVLLTVVPVEREGP